MSTGKPLMNTDVITTRILAPGQASFTTLNGTMTTDPAFQTWDNDLGSGQITMNTRRVLNLQESQETLLNFSQNIGGTAHWQSGGGWFDTGTPLGHTGIAQNNAAATNDEFFALVSQYPNRDDGEPIFNPLPSFEDNLKKVTNASAPQLPMQLPTITRFSDIAEFTEKITKNVTEQINLNVEAQTKLAMEMCKEELQEQIDQQEKLLTEKYGEEVYNMYYKAKVEAGYVFIKTELPYVVTKDDLYKTLLSNGRANRRNAHLAKI